MNRDNSNSNASTIIRFRSKDTNLYFDDTVRLIDDSHNLLIRRLHDTFAPFQKLCPIREVEERLNDTAYEDDYQRANSRLVGKVWKTMDLDTAGFLIGFNGCLGWNEILALLPFQLEILLRAESWVWPFDLLVIHLCRKEIGWSDYQKAYEDPSLRQLVHAALEAIQMKYANDPEFRIQEIEPKVNEALRDWAP